MGKIATLIVVCLSTFSAFCQLTDEQINSFIENSTEAELIEKNTLLSLDGNFHHAGMIAERLLELDTMNSNYNYRLGIALINSTSDFTKSAKYLERAAIKTSKNYDVFSTKEKAAPIDALFHLGRSYHLRGEIDKATKSYNNFLDKAPKKSENISLAQVKLQQCETAKELIKNPLEYEIVNLGPRINSKAADYSPVVSLDGSAIYFTTRRLRKDSTNIDIKDIKTNKYLEDIYVVYKGFNDEWESPIIMDFCSPEANEATVAVSSDERRIYLYKDEVGNGDIYYTDYDTNDFKELKEIETNGVNTKSWEPHLSVSPNGKFKYFVSDRKGGFGGRDIYRIEKIQNGEWSDPINLGPTINTKYDEDAPFIAVDNKTLYFSSNGPKSIGGFDIFKSQIDDSGQWTEPKNLGVPLNTPGDDIYYTTTMDGFTGYLSSFRVGGQGEKDIYEIKNTHLGIDDVAGLKGNIETTNGSSIPSDLAYTLECISCEEDYKVTLFPRVKDGRFYANLFPCETYEMSFHHENGQIEIYKDTFSTPCVDEYQEIYKKILLDLDSMKIIIPEEKFVYAPLKFKHYFGYNKNALNPEEGALKEFLIEVMDQHKSGRNSFVFHLESSASRLKTKAFSNNMLLAQTRADEFKKLIVKFLSDNNIKDFSIELDNVSVNGPEDNKYSKDFIDKYAPFQFVKFSLESLNLDQKDDGLIALNSKDIELSSIKNLPGVPVNSTMLKNSTSISMYESDSFQRQDNYNASIEMESSNQFHIIAGVFKYKRFANRFVKQLNDSGYTNAKIIGKRNGMFTVSVDSFDSLVDSRKFLSKVRNDVNSKAWILLPF